MREKRPIYIDGQQVGEVVCDGNRIFCQKCRKWFKSSYMQKTGNLPRACGKCKDKRYWKRDFFRVEA